MNHKSILYTALGCFLVFNSCKKDPKAEPEDQPTIVSCNKNTPVFAIPLTASDSFYDVYEDLERNILLLGKNVVAKYDYTGNAVWSKQIATTGIPQNIIQADGDTYFATSSTLEFAPSDDPERRELRLTNYWKMAPTLSSNCTPIYALVTKSFVDSPDIYLDRPPQNKSKCFLNKLDKDGNLLWTKTFDGNYFQGKSICKTPDHSYLLLTYKLCGAYGQPTFDGNGVFQDTIFMPFDQSTITVHKIDKNGNVLWSSTIEGIINEGASNKVLAGANIVSVQGSIFVQTASQIFVLDSRGNKLKEIKPYTNRCDRRALALTSYNGQAYAAGETWENPNIDGYLCSYDATGNLTMTLPSKNHFGGTYLFGTSDGLISITGTVTKTSFSDNLMWSFNGGKIMCATLSCREGLIYVSKKDNQLQLVKTDKDGKY